MKFGRKCSLCDCTIGVRADTTLTDEEAQLAIQAYWYRHAHMHATDLIHGLEWWLAQR